MFVWRNAMILGVIFIAVGVLYTCSGQGDGTTSTGPAQPCSIILGVAMAFVFGILLRGSREL